MLFSAQAGVMKRRARPLYSFLPVLVAFLFTCSLLPGMSASKVITLKSIQLFTNHDWIPLPFNKLTVYFRCLGENMTFLPDIEAVNVLYSFKGEESWQPLTVLPDDKCKRCGLYEKENFKPDDVFDEWELCPDDFSDGIYNYAKVNEFNATFSCPISKASETGGVTVSNADDKSKSHGKHTSVAFAVAISMLVLAVAIAATVAGFKYWQKWKRERDQARFLKIFEEGDDDIEDELGLGSII